MPWLLDLRLQLEPSFLERKYLKANGSENEAKSRKLLFPHSLLKMLMKLTLTGVHTSWKPLCRVYQGGSLLEVFTSPEGHCVECIGELTESVPWHCVKGQWKWTVEEKGKMKLLSVSCFISYSRETESKPVFTKSNISSSLIDLAKWLQFLSQIWETVGDFWKIFLKINCCTYLSDPTIPRRKGM